MKFEPLYYGDRLTVLNEEGDIGVVTLWTPVKTALKILDDIDCKNKDRIAVVGNLYGDGLPQLIRNLAYNPQLEYLLIFGQDLSDSRVELSNLLTYGPIVSAANHRLMIDGTARFIDSSPVYDYMVNLPITVYSAGSPKEYMTTNIRFFFDQILSPQRTCTVERKTFDLEIYQPTTFPSNQLEHTIVEDKPLDAWEQVVTRISRFGIPCVTGNKERIELLNLKVVINNPVEESDEHLQKYGFNIDDLHRYQKDLLNRRVPEGIHYSYGNRLRNFFKRTLCIHGWSEHIDSIIEAGETLKQDKTTRDVYLSLWDMSTDFLPKNKASAPCLVSIYFRTMSDNKLSMTACFRVHNAGSAWLKNVYGLIAIQNTVALHANLDTGPLTIISHSISLDPNATDRMDTVKQIIADRQNDDIVDRDTGKRSLRFDPHGYFSITGDRATLELVVQHKYQNDTLTEYRGKTAASIMDQIVRDNAISLVSHALYIGAELQKAEWQLKVGSYDSHNSL